MVSFRPKKKIMICADDYGLDPSINEGILALLEAGRISGVSCVMNGNFFDPKPLAPYHDRIGLHLNLGPSDGSGAYLLFLILKSLLKTLNTEKIFHKIEEQFDFFKKSFDQDPLFIDGHQHVHMFPGVRDILISSIKHHFITKPWIRSLFPCTHKGISLKKYVLLGLSTGFINLLEKEGFTFNPFFAGFSRFSSKAPVRPQVRFWLKNLPDKGLLMCHPALPSSKSLPSKRHAEFHYLNSREFLCDCTEFGVVVSGECRGFFST